MTSNVAGLKGCSGRCAIIPLQSLPLALIGIHKMVIVVFVTSELIFDTYVSWEFYYIHLIMNVVTKYDQLIYENA